MIRLEGLGMVFRRDGIHHEVLRPVSFTLPETPGLAILGRNGAGKSTLMRLIAGTLKPDRGRVHSDERVSWPMGFAGGLHPALTGAQNTRFVARIYFIGLEKIASRLREIAAQQMRISDIVEVYRTFRNHRRQQPICAVRAVEPANLVR